MLKARDVSQALTGKGFAEDNKRDHIYYFLWYNGRKSNIFTKISHAEREIGRALCSAMARQIRLTGPQFHEFIQCDLTLEQYIALLTSAGHLS